MEYRQSILLIHTQPLTNSTIRLQKRTIDTHITLNYSSIAALLFCILNKASYLVTKRAEITDITWRQISSKFELPRAIEAKQQEKYDVH